MTCTFIEDQNILWLQLTKIGSPPAWESGKIYNVGDLVVPRNPTVEQADMMFQCVGFLAKTPSSAPAWPSGPTEGETLISGNVEYVAQAADKPPAALAANQYYLINRNITVS